MSATNEAIRVVVRLRPSANPCVVVERENGGRSPSKASSSTALSSSSSSSSSTTLSLGSHRFAFDCVHPPDASTRALYDGEVKNLVEASVEGYNTCVMCYGQTGSGKTHTVMGSLASGGMQEPGILSLAASDIFALLEAKKSQVENQPQAPHPVDDTQPVPPPSSPPTFTYTVTAHFLEVYGEQVMSLSSPSKPQVQLRDVYEADSSTAKLVPTGDVTLSGCDGVVCQSAADLTGLAERGMALRTTGATQMNDRSSRSHAIFQVLVTQVTSAADAHGHKDTVVATPGAQQAPGVLTTVVSKMTLVDLAGSERQKKSKASGTRLKEGIGINKGLLVLGNVISSLSDLSNSGDSTIHVPFRESKLTRILRPCLSSNSKTSFIACCSVASSDRDETLCCLRYADRAKSIKVSVRKNVRRGGDADRVRRLTKLVRSLVAKWAETSATSEVDRIRSATDEDLAEGEWFAGPGGGAAVRRGLVAPGEEAEVDRLSCLVDAYRNEVRDVQEQLFAARAELAYLQMGGEGERFNRDLNVKSKVAEYERTIGLLKSQIKELQGRTVRGELERDRAGLEAVAEQYFTDSESDEEGEDDDGMTSREDAMADHLDDIDHTIRAKEELMDQLIKSRSKYEKMRGFYEEKLREMERRVGEREAEAAALRKEISESGGGKEGLKRRLEEKEAQISRLRAQKRELQGLTKVEARNEQHVQRLKDEVAQMKLQKVALRKSIDAERRRSRQDLDKARKDGDRTRRETSKWKREAARMKAMADDAKKMSRVRLEEANRTRGKYREAERRLRMQTLKRGVMKRAGLDSVILGKRGGDESSEHVRRWLGTRVEEVGKKEAAADKLALEWEERMELIAELEGTREGEARAPLERRLAKKEARIRQLSRILGKDAKEGAKDVDLLMSEDFREVVGGKPVDLATAEAAMKTLFGMVVRERRRVASLAKTVGTFEARASQLEMEKEKEKEEREDMKRAVDVDRAKMERDHERNLSALMMVVSGEEGGDYTAADSRVKVMEEKLEHLKGRLRDVQKDKEELAAYKMMERALNDALREKGAECERLVEERDELKQALRRRQPPPHQPPQVQRRHTSSPTVQSSGSDRKRPSPPLRPRPPTSKSNVSPPLGFAELSGDSSDDEEAPEWANDIMSDLALIAEGVMPESLLRSSSDSRVNDENRLCVDVDNANSSKGKKGGDDGRGVFQRLMSPSTYTGIHKYRKDLKKEVMPPPNVPPPPPPLPSELEAVKAASAVVHGHGLPPPMTSQELQHAFEMEAVTNSDGESTTPLGEHAIKSKKMQEYVNQNVFDRLQRKPTISQSLKHSGSGSADSDSLPGVTMEPRSVGTEPPPPKEKEKEREREKERRSRRDKGVKVVQVNLR